MLVLLQSHLIEASSPASPPPGHRRPPRREHPPPRRLRGGVAHALAATASRLDRERARRAVA
jgi:hypothetical protein